MTPIERAIELLDAMERRSEARYRSGNLGEWQTEINECRRCLLALVQHLQPRARFVYRPENEPIDTHESLGHGRLDSGSTGR